MVALSVMKDLEKRAIYCDMLKEFTRERFTRERWNKRKFTNVQFAAAVLQEI